MEVTKKILEAKQIPLNPNEIYFIAKEMGLASQLPFNGKTPWLSFGAAIYTDLKHNAQNSCFEVVQRKPKMLIQLKGSIAKSQNQTQKIPEESEKKKSLDKFYERDLHPLLVKFLDGEVFDCYAKTIYHESSQKSQKGTDKWLYPDVVAVNFEYANYENEIQEFMGKFDKLSIKLYSFEIKIELKVSNFREYYFQALSNSSWANEGYLVALKMDKENELLELIKKANNSFGIGLILLNAENIYESEIIARARFRELPDYSVMNELSNKNKNFKNFLNAVKDFKMDNKNRFKDEFDKVLDDEAFENYLIDKKIKSS
ncbi:HTH domain-containing protein [Helicobacter sp. 11S02596-1]|uniref:HTH domain-containing protein n=1 Tax=Helicobacter sp. 11S02596-1 TaxID=1476194 RepID=UPI000BA7A452|nr:HTH domain-containing protein [Helicobacter sp. 11S02596-1]PAF43575.1 hypothetical protein BJI48_04785 [Helicobacter sp. 11S02596-1]